MRVLLADDQPEVVSALRLILEQEPDLSVVGEAGDARRLLEQVHSANPDLVLLDWELPGPQPSELLTVLRADHPVLLVVAISGRPEARLAARDAGADAFASKGDPPESLLETVRSVAGRRQNQPTR